MLSKLTRMVPHGHTAINRARAMFTRGPSGKFACLCHEGVRATGADRQAGERLLSIIA